MSKEAEIVVVLGGSSRMAVYLDGKLVGHNLPSEHPVGWEEFCNWVGIVVKEVLSVEREDFPRVPSNEFGYGLYPPATLSEAEAVIRKRQQSQRERRIAELRRELKKLEGDDDQAAAGRVVEDPGVGEARPVRRHHDRPE